MGYYCENHHAHSVPLTGDARASPIPVVTASPSRCNMPSCSESFALPRRHLRRVRFSSATICQTPPVDAPSTTRWYTPEELDAWRTAARVECRSLPVRPGTCSLSFDAESRGLEQRACRERQRRRFLVLHCIAKQAPTTDSSTLAALSTKCTQYATQLAVEEAARDFYNAYGQSLHTTSSSRCCKRSADDAMMTAMEASRKRSCRPTAAVILP